MTTETRDVEALADEIAHDLVSPPDDDASPTVVADVMRYIAVAKAAALVVLINGGDCDIASDAAESALRDYDGDLTHAGICG